MDNGGTRAVCVWHRRAGKDKTLINIVIKKMLERVGSYYYFFPEFNQGRRILWDGIDKDGFKFLDHIPEELIHKKLTQEMKIIMKNGSILQIVGTDNYHAIRGTNPIGCVFSEYALQNPMAWEVVRPILRENGGWAIFNFTPLGHNHGHKIYHTALKRPNWFSQRLTVADTCNEDGERFIPEESIDEERADGMEEDMIQQEFFCSWEASSQGAIYSEHIKRAREQERICEQRFDPEIAVDTYWDLGFTDATGIWFVQKWGNEYRLIDYEEHTGETFKFFAQLLEAKKKEHNITYGRHYGPHDIAHHDVTVGSKLKYAEECGIYFDVAPKTHRKWDAVEKVRQLFNQFYINKDLVYAIDALTQYRKEYDEVRKIFKTHPVHDWTSHCADALSTLALTIEQDYNDNEYDRSYKDEIVGGALG